MMRAGIIALVIACVVTVESAQFSSITVDKVKRTADISTHVVSVDSEIDFTNDEGTISKFHYLVPEAEAEHLAYIVAKDGKKSLTVSPDPKITKDGYAVYVVKLGRSLSAGASATIRVETEFAHLLTPYPKEITQLESQMMLYSGDHFFASPYTVKKQSLTVKPGSKNIESYTKLRPSSKKGEEIIFGPYEDHAPFASSPLKVHYVNETPFVTARSVQREVEVSHWGAVSEEEVYDVQHTGARMVGGFSRFDYQMRRQQQFGSSVRTLRSLLPATAYNVYYRDQIGNVTTSALRPGHLEKGHKEVTQQLELDMRFPMFGGWNSSFYIGFNTPVQERLAVSGSSQFKLTVPLLPSLQGAVFDEVSLKLVLPEGATDVQVQVPPPFSPEEERSLRYTYLDVWGRPVVTLRQRQVAPVVGRPSPLLVVTYTLPLACMLQEPLMLVAFFAVLFATAMALLRLRLHITQPAEDAAAEQAYLVAQQDEIAAAKAKNE